jgi:hypothetical protein
MENLSISLVQSESTFYDLDVGAACLVAFCKNVAWICLRFLSPDYVNINGVLNEGNLLTRLLIGSNVTLSSVKMRTRFFFLDLNAD